MDRRNRKQIIVPEHVREKRLEETHEIYAQANENTDKEYTEIYQCMLKYDPKLMIDLFYKLLERDLANILTIIQDYYQSYDTDKVINLEDVLFKKDGKTLEERIIRWFETYSKPSQKQNLFHRLCTILDTEKYNMVTQTIKQKVRVEYIEIFRNYSEEDCDTGVCDDYADGEVHFADDWEEPPYHPRCVCEAVFYEETDIHKIEDLDDPMI